MVHLLSALLLATTFFTRVPLPRKLGEKLDHNSRLTDAVFAFPLIGFLIGGAIAGVYYASSMVLPGSIAAGLAIGFGVVLTGALHEDGLADCADGFGGASNRERALEIMRDSQIGTYGGVALIMSLGLRWSCLAALNPIAGVMALMVSHTVSRSAITIAMKWSSYARAKGLGGLASGEIGDTGFGFALAIPCLVGFALAQFTGLFAVLVGLFAGWLVLRYLQYRIGGYTGDGLGAIQQVSEISVLIIFAGFWT